eukprot:ctg_786.g162
MRRAPQIGGSVAARLTVGAGLPLRHLPTHAVAAHAAHRDRRVIPPRLPVGIPAQSRPGESGVAVAGRRQVPPHRGAAVSGPLPAGGQRSAVGMAAGERRSVVAVGGIGRGGEGQVGRGVGAAIGRARLGDERRGAGGRGGGRVAGDPRAAGAGSLGAVPSA